MNKNVKRCLLCNSDLFLLLHHLILPRKQGFDTDHINGNKLDNRKSNLRYATRSLNMMNKKDVKGIYWYKKTNKWQAQIGFNNKHIHLGYFIKEEDAIKARRDAEKKYFGEFAYRS